MFRKSQKTFNNVIARLVRAIHVWFWMTRIKRVMTITAFILCCTLPAHAACVDPVGDTGDILYNQDERVFQGCLSTGWVALQVPGGYRAEAVEFVPTEADRLYQSSPLSGVVDSKQMTGSMWIKTNTTRQQYFFYAGNPLLRSLSNGRIRVQAANALGTQILRLDINNFFVNDGQWHHIIFSVDLSDPTRHHVYINDQAATINTATDVFINDDIDFTVGDGFSGFGAPTAGSGAFQVDSLISDAWFEAGLYIDLSVEENRRKFIDARGYPVYLGENGERPTGQSPDIFLSGDTANWHINKGTGGGFTENGELSFGGYVAGTGQGHAVCNTVGQVCADGTIYAGTSPDGGVPMYTTRCDAGQTWDGSACINARDKMPWNNGNSMNKTLIGATDFNSGIINTTKLINADADSDTAGIQPHQAAHYCIDLVYGGHSDWYLPSAGEMDTINTNAALIGNLAIGGGFGESYWSSWERSVDNAHRIEIGGPTGQPAKETSFNVRCVRKSEKPTSCFSPPGIEGDIVYNADEGVFQGCVGSHWEALHEPAYVPNAVNFDGATHLEDSTPINNNRRTFTFSIWVKPTALGRYLLYSGGGGRSAIELWDNRIGLVIDRSNSSSLLSGTFLTGTHVNNNEWNHILISVDSNTPGRIQLYINDTDVTPTYSFSTNDTNINWWFGKHIFNTFGGPSLDPFAGQISDFWLSTSVSLDLSVEANRRKFIDANGYPVYLGENGERVTGQAPDIFLSGDTANWHTNKGTGGGFTENGTLTDGDPVTKAGSPTIPTDGLIAHYEFEETSGQTVVDSSGNANNSSLSNSSLPFAFETASVAGIYGRGLRFPGQDPSKPDWATEGRVTFPTFTETDDLTFSIWINEKYRVPYTRLIASADGFNVAIYNSFITLAETDSWTGGFNDDLRYNTTILTGTWNHIVVTYEAATKEFQLYVNNQSGGSRVATAYTGSVDRISNSGNGIIGKVDDLRVYDRVLTPAEIAALYEQGKPCTSPVAFNGDLLFNTNEDTFQGCTRTGWKAIGGTGP